MSRLLTVASLALVVALSFVSEARCGFVNPSGMAYGAKFRYVFVTSGTSTASSSNIATYDGIVANAAAAAGLTTYAGQSITWQVLGSTAVVSANSRIPSSSAPIFLIDGNRVATSGTDLWNGSIERPININETGTSTGTANVHVGTGTLSNGDTAGLSALGGTSFVAYGSSSQTDAKWVADFYALPGDSLHFYAVSNELSAVPEPCTMALMLVGLGGIGGARLFRRRGTEVSKPEESATI